MDDEVFVTVKFQLEDFVRARRLALFTRFRETNAPQMAIFVAIGAVGVLFFAPDPIGRIFASVGGAFIGLLAVLLVWGLIRASRPTPMPIEEAAIEVSDAGIVVKIGAGHARLRWRDFEQVVEGQGVFFGMGKIAVIVPMRALRRDQIEMLRAITRAHAQEIGSSGESALAASPAEKNDSRGAERKDDSDR